ncbi:MAG: hypothetical protein NTV61_01085 [Candidatus Bathyarchaeota archaeon]|nr:hypothetical protein [Candidatus Bathyarchaeota archaeon]
MEKIALIFFLPIALVILLYSISLLDVNTQINNAPNIPMIHYQKLNLTTWWITGPRSPELIDGAYKTARDRLTSLYQNHTDPILEENLVSVYVNPHNNTIFVALIKSSGDIQSHIIDIMQPPSDVTVIFRKGSASLSDLEKYEKIVLTYENELARNNVTVTVITKTVNGTILMGIRNLDPPKAESIARILDGKIPLGVLELWDANENTVQ